MKNIHTRIRWTSLPAGDGRSFVYSPRFGRTYLLAGDLAESMVLPALFGLQPSSRFDCLSDPAVSVHLAGAFEEPLVASANEGLEAELVAADAILQRLYLFFHGHRTLASIGRTICFAKWFIRRRSNQPTWGTAEIGRIVMAVERSVGISDCYPRALLTAYLCLIAERSCEVTVGIIAPTKIMHAWCSTEGIIPYEPITRHWWYSPLVIFDVGG